jgi:hypothetical protein
VVNLVNEDFQTFNKEQQKHKSSYLAGEKSGGQKGIEDPAYNGQGNTDLSVGATGRKQTKE